jgi:hypothetical protein
MPRDDELLTMKYSRHCEAVSRPKQSLNTAPNQSK